VSSPPPVVPPTVAGRRSRATEHPQDVAGPRRILRRGPAAFALTADRRRPSGPVALSCPARHPRAALADLTEGHEDGDRRVRPGAVTAPVTPFVGVDTALPTGGRLPFTRHPPSVTAADPTAGPDDGERSVVKRPHQGSRRRRCARERARAEGRHRRRGRPRARARALRRAAVWPWLAHGLSGPLVPAYTRLRTAPVARTPPDVLVGTTPLRTPAGGSGRRPRRSVPQAGGREGPGQPRRCGGPDRRRPSRRRGPLPAAAERGPRGRAAGLSPGRSAPRSTRTADRRR
jgi:hypothetical protein